jgi:dolichol-phosphate mannosyltransferase
MKSIIVVPTYNEADNIAALFTRIAEYAPDTHVIVADDGSPDGTADLADRLCEPRPGWRVYRRTGPRGLGHAYVDTFSKVVAEGYERIVQMDADLSHDPAYLPALFAASEHADLVIGSRYCPGGGVANWPLKRLLLSRGANAYVRMITGVPTNDATAGFRCWSGDALRAVRVDTVYSEGYSFQVEMVYRAMVAGLRIAEVPIVFTDRQAGHSKMSHGVIMESVMVPWRLRAQRRRVL